MVSGGLRSTSSLCDGRCLEVLFQSFISFQNRTWSSLQRLTHGGVREGMTGWGTWPRLCAPGRSCALCARVPTKPEAECFSRPRTLTLLRHLLTNPRCPAPPSGPNSVRWALESAPWLPHDPHSWTGLPCPKPGQPAGGSLCHQLLATSLCTSSCWSASCVAGQATLLPAARVQLCMLCTAQGPLAKGTNWG